MKKRLLIIVGLVAVSALAFRYSDQPKALGEQVSYFAKVKTLSTSGSAAFYYYDPEKGEADCEREDGWFWGVLRQAEDDRKALDYFQFLSDRESAVFRVTGVRDADDCGYIEGKCLQTLILDKVELVKEL